MTREQLDAELQRLNVAVDAALAARTAWMDAHMVDYAKHPIGTEVFTRDGTRMGVVAKYYRYHANQDPLYDTSMHVCYRFDNGDNTSHYADYKHDPDALCDAEELAQTFRDRAKALLR